jgi:hypothetical protein
MAIATTTAITIALAVAAAAAAAGTAYSAVAANDAAQAQAAQQKDQALSERAAAAQQEAAQRRKLQQVIASQDALRAGRGVSLTSGTALSIYDDTLDQGKKDIAAARLNNLSQVQRYRYAANQSQQEGRDALIGGSLKTTGHLATSAGYGYSAYQGKDTKK